MQVTSTKSKLRKIECRTKEARAHRPSLLLLLTYHLSLITYHSSLITHHLSLITYHLSLITKKVLARRPNLFTLLRIRSGRRHRRRS